MASISQVYSDLSDAGRFRRIILETSKSASSWSATVISRHIESPFFLHGFLLLLKTLSSSNEISDKLRSSECIVGVENTEQYWSQHLYGSSIKVWCTAIHLGSVRFGTVGWVIRFGRGKLKSLWCIHCKHTDSVALVSTGTQFYSFLPNEWSTFTNVILL